MIVLENLTLRQKVIAQEMWQIQTMEEMKDYISSLSYRDQLDANSLIELILQESLEAGIENDTRSYDLAQMAIVRAMRH